MLKLSVNFIQIRQIRVYLLNYSPMSKPLNQIFLIFLDLCISRFAFTPCQIKLIQLNFNIYMLIDIKFGQ